MPNELTHYGVEGMKWGIRRSEAQLAKARGSKTDDISKLSDDELRRRVNRLNMEQQYKKLTSSASTSKGADYMKKIYKAGTTVAAVTTTALTLYNNADKIKKIVEKMVSK